MGTLRTLFALAVVFAHCWPGGSVLVGGRNAVQLFYMISGFLISYVLVERKSYATLGAFYVNRYLRLYPLYVLVAALSLVAILVTRQQAFLDVYRFAPPGAIALLTFSNLFLFGQDWVMFAGVRHDALAFVASFNASDVVLYRGLLVTQAWTLGVELSFYLIAPFILPRRRLVYGLLIGSLALRAGLVAAGLGTHDPWTYRFFPTELALFLGGALAHQVLRPRYLHLSSATQQAAANGATALMVVLSILYPFVPVDDSVRTGMLFATFLLALPLTFTFQSRYRVDRWLGELSYPIYVVHVLAVQSLKYLAGRSGAQHPYALAIASVIASVACAMALNHFIARPFEAIRDRLRSSRGRTPQAAPLKVSSC